MTNYEWIKSLDMKALTEWLLSISKNQSFASELYCSEGCNFRDENGHCGLPDDDDIDLPCGNNTERDDLEGWLNAERI